MRHIAIFVLGILVTTAVAFEDFDGPFDCGLNHPAIEYTTRPADDPISILNRRIQNGEVQLKYDENHGYLQSALEALGIPVESQMLVFSKTSFQSQRISPQNPRAIFFNDAVSVGWVRGGPVMEIATEDPRQGVIFYTLDQKSTDKPQFTRRNDCLGCHESYSSLDVPGMLVKSVFPSPGGLAMYQFGSYITDDHSPFEERWGGWYVTGTHGSLRHMGNAVVTNPDEPEAMVGDATLNVESLDGRFETDAYLSPYSDIVALMVFGHQMRVTNLLTRVGWTVRVAQYGREMKTGGAKVMSDEFPSLLRYVAKELVDSLLFVNEAPLGSKVQGLSGFTKKFASQGPADSNGRSLRQLDLEHRLMRYPCSYMIYSEAFDALPSEVIEAVYRRMWEILSGAENGAQYSRLSLSDRKAIVEILRETKKGLPDYFTLSLQ